MLWQFLIEAGAKRGVECGGYKKDFKWRAYEETQMSSKAPKNSRKSM